MTRGVAEISVVISTYQRPARCVEAVRTALAQGAEPLEVLVCDDASEDETAAVFREWAARDRRVRYLRNARRSGTPAVGRNAGIRAAQGDWIAFLDDDDRWHPTKLERQSAHLDGRVAIIATNARRTSGPIYFPDLHGPLEVDRRALHRLNPVIVSSAVVSRRALIEVGGFPTQRWARGVADYATWLKLADHGARVLVLPDVLLDYDDEPSGRMSASPVRQELALARWAWKRWRTRPTDTMLAAAALGHTRSAIQQARAR